MKVQAIILAGGKSSRMGTNKALLELHETKVIERIIEEMKKVTNDLIIIANDPSLYKHYGYPLYKDRYTNKGPLAGLESALYYMEGDVAVISPCDTPFIHDEVYKHMLSFIKDYDAVVPKFDGRLHPLAGIYKKSIHPFIKENIENKKLRMTSFFNDIHVKIVDDFSFIDPTIAKMHFFNMNTIEDFERAKRV